MMKKIIVLMLAVLVAAGSVSFAVTANVPSGVTGLWTFATSADKLKATVGVDLQTSNPGNSYFYTTAWSHIGTTANPEQWTNNGCVQERSWDYLTVNPSFHANGGGDYVNQYTVAIDYIQTTGVGDSWNSLFQTAWGGNDNDGDLFIAPDGTIGIGDVGYSSMAFDPGQWHRIMWSVDNGDADGVGGFFRVYVDGVLFLDGAGQGMDGRMSLYPDQFELFADNDWEDQWGLVSTVATWDHALTSSQIAAMGDVTTPLIATPEPATMSLLALGGLALLRRRSR